MGVKLKISPLIIPLAAAAAFMHYVPQLAAAYAVMTAHECAHLIAALCIGLRPDTLSLSPFGAHLTLKNKIIRSMSDEIILYGAGPLLNGILAVLFLRLGVTDMYRLNTALMIINLIPVPPLDGGVILKRILSARIGKAAAERMLAAVSVILSAVFFAAAVCGLVTGAVNLSMFIMAVFFMGNAVTGHELYDTDLAVGLTGKKNTNRVRIVLINDDYSVLDAVKSISPEYTTVALMEQGDTVKLIPERELIIHHSD